MNRTEAIEVIRKCWPVNRNGLLSDALETLIPEFRESEDERIRKALLRCCDDWEKGRFGCMAKEDVPAIRAYLERQKEQKHLSNFVVDAAFDAREPRDNWEYIKEFCDKFGRMPKDMDELDALVSYVIDKKQKEQKHLSTEETELNSVAFLEQMGYTCIPPEKEQKSVNFYFPKGVDINTPKSKIAVIIGQYAVRTGMNKDEYHSLLETLNTQSKQKLTKKDKKIIRALQHALNCADAQNAITKSGTEVSEVATFLQDLVSSYDSTEKQDHSGLNDLEKLPKEK